MSLYLQSIHKGDRYLIPIDDVLEVTPYVHSRPMPRSPGYVVGIIDYRGEALPLIDVSYLLSEQTSKDALSSRILIGVIKDLEGNKVTVAWLFEGMTETIRIDESLFEAAPVHLSDSAYLGDVVTDENGVMQRILLQKILPEQAYDILF